MSGADGDWANSRLKTLGKNDVVLDPFAGSGTTLQAAVELGRHAIGIDVAPEFVAMCQERLTPVQTSLWSAA